MYQGSLKGVSRKSQESFNEVSRCLKKVSRVFQGRLKGVLREFQLFQGYLKEVKGNSRDVSKVFQVCFRELLRVFQVSF